MKPVLALFCTLALLSACAPGIDVRALDAAAAEAAQRNRLDNLAYSAVDRLFDGSPALLSGNATVIVGSLENIQDINSSTPFGNIISELVRTRLVERGAHLTDIRVRSSVLLRQHAGEMLLSRDKHALVPPPAVTSYVTGTYAVGSGRVYVTLRLVSAQDGRIEGAADFVADRTDDVTELLYGRG